MSATLSVEAQAEAALFDRIKNLKALIEAVNKAIAAEGVKAQVAAWLDVIALGASFTAATNDDALVVKLREILSSPMAEKVIGIIADLVGDLMGEPSAKSADEQAADKASVEAAAIPWTLLLTIAKVIFDLIKSFKSKE